MIQIYTGNGKGKTTAALGLALRAFGAGLRVYIAQFVKGKECSELKALKHFSTIKVEQFGTCRFIKKISPKDTQLAEIGLNKVKAAILSKKFDLIILDEINITLGLKLLDLEKVIEIIRLSPKKTELVLTGRNAPAKIIKIADLVSEIKEIKHYFSKGLKARKGIEY